MSGALVLDFDGVVCDALEECALVTWLGLHGVDPDLSVSSYRRALDEVFLTRFAAVRAHSRTLSHFAVAHLARALPATGRAEFEEQFAALPTAFVTTFVRRANTARTRCRSEEPRFWLGLHALYPGIVELISRHAGRVHVITAKDERSVRSIVRAHGLDGAIDHVHGEVSAKDTAMRKLCADARLDPSDVIFVDDSLHNVERVTATGVRAHWATWGYHTPEDRRRAESNRVPQLTLADLDRISIRS